MWFNLMFAALPSLITSQFARVALLFIFLTPHLHFFANLLCDRGSLRLCAILRACISASLHYCILPEPARPSHLRTRIGEDQSRQTWRMCLAQNDQHRETCPRKTSSSSMEPWLTYLRERMPISSIMIGPSPSFQPDFVGLVVCADGCEVSGPSGPSNEIPTAIESFTHSLAFLDKPSLVIFLGMLNCLGEPSTHCANKICQTFIMD